MNFRCLPPKTTPANVTRGDQEKKRPFIHLRVHSFVSGGSSNFEVAALLQMHTDLRRFPLLPKHYPRVSMGYIACIEPQYIR